MSEEKSMSTLERLSDARGTLEGKIVAVVLAILLVLPVVGVTAFAEDEDHLAATGTERVADQEVVDTVVEELPDQGATPVVPEASQPAPTEAAPEQPAPAEPEANEIALDVNLAEGSSIIYKEKTYDVFTEHVNVAAEQPMSFSVQLAAGFALAGDAPVAMVSAEGAKTEVASDGGMYTVPVEQLGKGLVLTVETVRTDDAADVEEDAEEPQSSVFAWVRPASVQSIMAKSWCTTLPLGNADYDTDAIADLGSQSGAAPSSFAAASIEKGGNVYTFHHAQVQTAKDQQTNADGDGDKYDASVAISALRYNQSIASWQYLMGGTWTSFSISSHQLVFYYNQLLSIGSGDDDVNINAKDWPYTESEWVEGKGNGYGDDNRSCVIYQIYDVSGNKIGNQIRTYYYSPNADKAGLSLQIGQYWEIQEIAVKPIIGAAKPTPPNVYTSVASPDRFDSLVAMAGGYVTTDTENFDIPFVRLGNKQHNVWMVGMKVNALPSEQTLTVEYLDEKSGNVIPGCDAISVAAKKPNGTAAPTWDEYISISGGKAVPKSGSKDSVSITTNIGSSATSVVPLTISNEAYDSQHVRAVLEGNTLKLYFPRVYGVSYEWEGLPSDTELLAQNGKPLAGLPTNDAKYLEGAEYQVSTLHDAATRAFAVVDGKVTAIYQFSGWKLDGNVVEGKQPMGDESVVLKGVWDKLTVGGSVSIESWTYDGTAADDGHSLTASLEGVASTLGYGEPTYTFFEMGGNALDAAPSDAGTYTVTATWAGDGTRPEVTAITDFTISKRPVTLLSASADKVFDGTPLTKHEMVEAEQLENGGFLKGQGVDIAFTGEQTTPGSSDNEYTPSAWDGTNLANYEVTTNYGTLTVTERGNDLIPVTLMANSKRLQTYTGEPQSVEGLASADAVVNGTSYSGVEQDGQVVLNIGGTEYFLSGYKTGIEAINTGEYTHNITAKDGYVIKNAKGEDVSKQFTVEAVSGILEIVPRPVTLKSASATKVYDGAPLTAPLAGSVDEVLAREANVATTGTVINVADSPAANTIAVTAKADREEGVNEYLPSNYHFTMDEGALTITPQSIVPVDPTNPDDPEYKGIQIGDLSDRQYNGKADAQTPAVTTAAGTPLTESDDYTVSVDRNGDRTNAGTVTITVTGKGNYTGTATRSYQIQPAPTAILVNDAAKKFGEDDPEFTGTPQVLVGLNADGTPFTRGLFENDRNGNAADELGAISYERTNAGVEDAGSYPDVLNAVVTNRNPNYQEPTIFFGDFTINPADAATIDAASVVKTFDGQGGSINASVEDGWILQYSTDEGDDKTWSEQNPVSDMNVGVYTVYVKATRDNYNEAGPVSATVTINPAPVTIRVANATKVAGGADPTFTGAVEGEVAGYPLANVSYFRTNDAEGVGTYADVLSARFDENPNYEVTVENGDFTITAIPVPAAPPTPGPLDGIVDFLATPIVDDPNPMANIDDDGNPLAAFDHPICWVHYYILLGIIITAIYGGGVIVRRLNYNRKVKGYEDDVTGKSESKERAGSTAASAKAQPTMAQGSDA